MSCDEKHVDITPETRCLDQEMADALGVPKAAFIVAFDVSGKPVRFERPGTKDLVFPVLTERVASLHAITLMGFQGSDCSAQVDTTGSGRVVCYPW